MMNITKIKPKWNTINISKIEFWTTVYFGKFLKLFLKVEKFFSVQIKTFRMRLTVQGRFCHSRFFILAWGEKRDFCLVILNKSRNRKRNIKTWDENKYNRWIKGRNMQWNQTKVKKIKLLIKISRIELARVDEENWDCSHWIHHFNTFNWL